MNFDQCRKISRNKSIDKCENNRKITIKNTKNHLISSIQVDGCLIINGLKCDWLFEIFTHEKESENPFIAIYVELKGSDIRHAIEQLKETIIKLQDRHKNAEKFSYIISSRVPPATRSNVVIAKKLFKTNYATTLSIKNKEVTHTI